MSHFSDEHGAELRELFFESAQELLQSLDEEALKLEKQPGDAETVRSVRRIVHTLKGDAAASGFHELSECAHEFEDALGLETVGAHASLAEIAFAAGDLFSAMLKAYRKQTKVPSTESLRKKISDLTKQSKVKRSRNKKSQPASEAAVAWTEYEKLGVRNALNQGKRCYQVSAQIDPRCAMPIAARQLILKALSEIGEVIGARPDPAAGESSKRFDLLLASDKSAEAVAAKSHIPTIVSQVKVDQVPEDKNIVADAKNAPKPPEKLESAAHESCASDVAAPTSQSERNERPSASSGENILRVEAERIDNVLNLVGELIIGKSMLQQAFNEFARHHPKDALRGRFADAMAFQARVLNDLQRSVMKVRMVPVEQLFRRFPRMVRDVARQCGREVELVLSGQDTDLDKSLLDAIAEPLTHLVRNAVGHGIESPEERVRSGKPAQGKIRLDAYHQGNQVIVEISDDGRGIDIQKVKARALQQHLVTPEHAARLTETEIFDFIFRAGFTTAEEITEVAGRGVGLDVVQSVLQRLKGTVEVQTRPGQGTTFVLRLPLTVAIIKALLFRVEHRLYAVPLNAVSEIARAHESDLHRIDNTEVMQLRNHVLHVVRLGRPAQGHIDAHSAKIFVLVISVGERRLGLLVNSLEGEEELVIKALDDQTVETDLVSGASILGDGRVVLILNLAAIVERSSKSQADAGKHAGVGLLLSQSERTGLAHPAAGGQS